MCKAIQKLLSVFLVFDLCDDSECEHVMVSVRLANWLVECLVGQTFKVLIFSVNVIIGGTAHWL